jgi:hypothetical protein
MSKEELTEMLDSWVKHHKDWPMVAFTPKNLVDIITMVMDNYESKIAKGYVKAYVVKDD